MKTYHREPKPGERVDLPGKHNRRWRRRFSWIVLEHGTFRLREWRIMRKNRERHLRRRLTMRDRNLAWKWRKRNLTYSEIAKPHI